MPVLKPFRKFDDNDTTNLFVATGQMICLSGIVPNPHDEEARKKAGILAREILDELRYTKGFDDYFVEVPDEEQEKTLKRIEELIYGKTK